MLVVLTVISILMTMFMPNLLVARRRARYASAQSIKKSNQIDSRCFAYYSFEDGYGSRIENLGLAGTIESPFSAEEFNARVMRNGAPCSTAWTTGRFRWKNALYFNGLDTYVDCGRSDGWQMVHDECTMMAWVYAKEIDLNAIVTREFGMYVVNGQWGTGVSLASGPANLGWAEAEPLERETWTHIAVVYDGSMIKIYKDGFLAAGATNPNAYSGGISHAFEPTNLTIGALHVGLDQYADYWNGVIDELALYKEAFTAAEIHDHYDRSRPR